MQAGLTGIFTPFREPSGNGIPSSPLLITPIRQKRYDMYQSSIESLWQQSADAMKTVERVVIIGYSFPPTDTRPLELLRNVLSSRKGHISVEIVAPSAQDIVSRIAKGYLSKAKSVIAHSVTFENYLQTLWKDAPKLMKRAAAKHSEVKAWLERIYMLGQIASKTYQK
jgi:hypothetical protein